MSKTSEVIVFFKTNENLTIDKAKLQTLWILHFIASSIFENTKLGKCSMVRF